MVEEEPENPAKDLEDVELVEGDPTKVTKVGGCLDHIEGQDHRALEEESRYLHLDPLRYPRHRQQGDRAPIKCRPHKEAHPTKAKGLRS